MRWRCRTIGRSSCECCSAFVIATGSSASSREIITPKRTGTFRTAGWWKTLPTKLAGDTAVKFHEAIDRSKFFKSRYKLDVKVPIEQHDDIYLPYEEIGRAKSELQDGDFVNIVRATSKPHSSEQNEVYGGTAFVGHVGLIAHGKDGEVHLIHSSEPKVREETIDSYISPVDEGPQEEGCGRKTAIGRV